MFNFGPSIILFFQCLVHRNCFLEFIKFFILFSILVLRHHHPPTHYLCTFHSVESNETDNVCVESSVTDNNVNNVERTTFNLSRKRKRRCNVSNVETSKYFKSTCSRERTEVIHESLAKLIAMNQLLISFCLSVGFTKFMAVVEPNYNICKQEAIKVRIKF